MLTIFYVSDDESEWESDREDIKIGEQLCYAKNLDNEDCSKYGFICFQKNCGGMCGSEDIIPMTEKEVKIWS